MLWISSSISSSDQYLLSLDAFHDARDKFEPCLDNDKLGSTLKGSSWCEPKEDGGCQTENEEVVIGGKCDAFESFCPLFFFYSN